jgi:protein involved in polysaccharide export with SLBB domain
MRNHSSAHESFRRMMLRNIACAAVFAICASVSHAQCSAQDESDSYNCQLQGSPLPSATQSTASPTVLTMQETPQQSSPRADLSTEASAEQSLSGGANYTERSLRNNGNAAGLRRARLEPPEPLTEFQRFVAASTGRLLPIFGVRLFAARPASFGPIDQGPAPQDMVIGTGDELRIRIWGQINFSANLRVSREGDIYLPKAGAVHVAGLPFSSVAGHLRQALDRIYRNFELSVDMGEIHSIQIYVAGQARQPGEFTVSALSTLVNAIFLSGGPSQSGSMRHVELKRGGKVLTDFDLYALLVNGDKTGDVQLQAGDVLFIPAVGSQVALLGSVRQEAIYELRGQESIEMLLTASGGRTAIASGGRIAVERTADHAQRSAFELQPDAEGLATLLVDGDTVRIDPIVSSYRETVTLRGSVANPGHFLWHQGMRLSDLMPDRDSLLSRDYWWRRTRLGLPAPEFVSSNSSPVPQAESVRHSQAASGERQAVSPGDRFTAMSKSTDTQHETSAGTLANSEVNGQTEREAELIRPEFQTNWNYAVIERMDTSTMATSLIPFDLGKLVLGHDASQDRELQPGDVVTIFSQNDIHLPVDGQTKYVRLEGEFVHAGVYSVLPGESLRSLVERAGGLTDKAYLYGSEFTRKSTQAIEQQRLREYSDRLEHQLTRGAIKMAGAGIGGANSGSQDAAQQAQVATFDRELLTHLRQLQPTGRIVLNLRPQSMGDHALPEIPLEDGDQLQVPSTPATIQVVGAVQNQNAFLYRNNARAGEYLHLAGGVNRDADRGQIFILRADGSVTGHGAGQSIFASGFDNIRLYPGDTIIVPEKNVSPGAMREFLSWTQVFSQLALGAAAINVIK